MKLYLLISGLAIFLAAVIAGMMRICYKKRQRQEEHAQNEADRILQEEKKRREEQARRKEEEQRRREQEKKGALARSYWSYLAREAEQNQNQEYIKVFVRYAGFYQTIFGLLRRREREPELLEGYLLDELETIVNNSGLRQGMSDGKFRVKQRDTGLPDKEQVEKRCMEHSIAILERETERKRKICEKGSETDQFYVWVTETAPLVTSLLDALDRENIPELLNFMERIAEILKKNGCRAIFADDPEVMKGSSLIFDFIDVASDATELPALYTLEPSGEYSRVGHSIGTRRTTV